MVYTNRWHEGQTEGMYDFSHIGWLIEMIIDAIVKDGTDISFVREARQALYKSLAKVPRWALKKLSKATREKYKFEVEETELDKVIAMLEAMADEYDEFLVRHTHWLVLEKWADVDGETFKPYRYMAAHPFTASSAAGELASAIEAAYRHEFKACRLHLIGCKQQGRLEAERLKLKQGLLPKSWREIHSYALGNADELMQRPDIKKLWNDPEILGLAYQMAEREVYRLFHKDPNILKAFVVLWGRIYRKATDNAPYKLADGLLWGRYTSDLTIEALVWARDNMPGPQLLNPKDALEPGIIPAPAPIPAESVTAEVRGEAFTPIPNDDSLWVVNGNFHKLEGGEITREQLDAWKRKLNGAMVDLVPVYWRGTKAYQVQVAGNLKGWVDAQQAVRLWNKTGGKQRQAMVGVCPGHPCMMEARIVLQ
jgi:hypothetical protein